MFTFRVQIKANGETHPVRIVKTTSKAKAFALVKENLGLSASVSIVGSKCDLIRSAV